MRLILAVGPASVLIAIGCGPSSVGSRCSTADDCSAGAVCVDGACRARGMADAGTVDPDPPPPPPRDAAPPDAGPCLTLMSESSIERTPLDVIVAVDNSGSMGEEAEQVRLNLNRFADILDASGLDFRVVLLSEPDGDRGVCIPAPLGSGPPDCGPGPDGRLRAVHVSIGSNDAPDVVIDSYEAYEDFLRPGAAKAFLWVTDDESGAYSPDSFRAAVAALAPDGMFETVIHNAIVAYYGDEPVAWSDPDRGSCETLADVGETYLRLTRCLDDTGGEVDGCTEGVHARVCESDWTAIFEDIAEGVLAGVPAQCELELPDPPMGMTLDLDAIRITYTRGDGGREELVRVDGPAACRDGAWHLDDAAAPSRILLCPELCRRVQADDAARLDVGLGCFPILD